MPKFDATKLENLSPDLRARVESALAKTLEAEIASQPSAATVEAAQHSRSRGAIFSRSRTGAGDAIRPGGDLDAKIVEKIDTLDDAAFERFTSRLTALKGGPR
jgi:hypothetical protein